MTKVHIVFRGLIAFQRDGDGMNALLVNRDAWTAKGMTKHNHIPRLEVRSGMYRGKARMYGDKLPQGAVVDFLTVTSPTSTKYRGLGTRVSVLDTFDMYVPKLDWFYPNGKAPGGLKLPATSTQGRVIIPGGTLGATDLVRWTSARHDEPSVPQEIEFANVLDKTYAATAPLYLADICTLSTTIEVGRVLVVRVKSGSVLEYYKVEPAANGEIISEGTIEVTIRNNSPQSEEPSPLGIHFKAFFDGVNLTDFAASSAPQASLPSGGSKKEAEAEAEVPGKLPYPRLRGVVTRPRNPARGTEDRPLCIPIWG